MLCSVSRGFGSWGDLSDGFVPTILLQEFADLSGQQYLRKVLNIIAVAITTILAELYRKLSRSERITAGKTTIRDVQFSDEFFRILYTAADPVSPEFLDGCVMNPLQLSPEACESADQIIRMALQEDLQGRGDLTSLATVPSEATAAVNIVARENGRLSGAVLIEPVYRELCIRMNQPPEIISVTLNVNDGDVLDSGTVIASVSGPIQLLLTGERIVLNFLIHLSGIASKTAEFVRLTDGSNAVILDTRKTLPGYRLLHKYAVRCGGGTNHRMGLYDGMLIKDNHLAARGNLAVADAVVAARQFLASKSLNLPVEVEVDTLDQLRDALAAAPEIVLLDNMKPPQLQQAVTMRDQLSPSTLLEASGGVNLQTVGCIAGTGVDRISIGGLTHSAPALDIGYDWPW